MSTDNIRKDDGPNPLGGFVEPNPILVVREGTGWKPVIFEDTPVIEKKGLKTPSFIQTASGESVQSITARKIVKSETEGPKREVIDKYTTLVIKAERETWDNAKAAVESGHATTPPRNEQQREGDRNPGSALGITNSASHASGAETVS